MKRVSIVIPTMNRNLVLTCINSIVKESDMTYLDIIVVSNGADKELIDDIEEYVLQGIDINLIWFDNPLGAVPALNAGIKAATGEYVLLLNDDCVILPSKKNYWIETLLEPFSDPLVGCTGPFKMNSGLNKDLVPEADREFILFFCALIPNKLFEMFGILDEDLRCGVDIDFCIRLQLAGYKLVQVPETKLYHDENNNKQLIGGFPIFHEGEATVHDHYGFDKWQEIIKEDIDVLNKKYININVKQDNGLPDGYFGEWDIAVYRQMVDSLPDNGCFAEVGSLLGKGLCSVADIIIKKNLKVISIDLFNDFHDKIFDKHFPNQLENFKNNIKKFGIYNHVQIKQGSSIDISNQIENSSLDLVYIDADHEYESIKEDLLAWYPKVKPGGVLAGHDIEWPSVKQALTDVLGIENVLGEYNGIYSSNCWYTIKPRVYDGFMFFNELDVLEIRLNELYNSVTKFIIVEGRRKINGEVNNDMYLLNNMERFDKFKDKIVHIIVDDFPEVTPHDPWAFERHLRDSIIKGWIQLELRDNDVVIVSDADEIPRSSIVSSYKIKDGFSSLIQGLYYFYLNCYCHEWEWQKIVPFSIAKHMTPCQIRYTEAMNKIKDGGWHFSFMGGSRMIEEKMKSYAHQEYNTPEYLDRIENAIKTGEDIFKRPGIKGTIVSIDESFPKYVYENIDQFHYKELIKFQNFVTEIKPFVIKNESDVVCFIATKNRYDSTLPLAIQSVCMQNVKPDKLIIYDDNTEEQRIDIRENETYRYLLEMLDFCKIKWTVIFGMKQGQHHGHQLVNKTSGYKFVWRLDDDEIASPDVLEKYLSYMTDGVGAVGGVVLTRGYGGQGSPKLEDIYSKPNIQWSVGDNVIEVDHLHSTFLYRANIVDFCLELSPVAHREETLFTHELQEKGYKLIVDQTAITYHLKQQSTGIRSHDSEWFYKHDEKLFSKKMEEWGYKLVTLNSGLGDHLAFLNILPALKKKWKHLIIGVCYPESFFGTFKNDPNITLISIAQSEPINPENIYEWMDRNHWKKSLVEAYAKYYEVEL